MFKSVHLALPVRDLAKAMTFFEDLFGARIIARDQAHNTCTLAYGQFEYSLFEMPHFEFSKRELGPFHIGHEVHSRSLVDEIHNLAIEKSYEITSAPFDRDDGDYALFIRGDQGIIFEFFYGGHHAARARLLE